MCCRDKGKTSKGQRTRETRDKQKKREIDCCMTLNQEKTAAFLLRQNVGEHARTLYSNALNDKKRWFSHGGLERGRSGIPSRRIKDPWKKKTLDRAYFAGKEMGQR